MRITTGIHSIVWLVIYHRYRQNCKVIAQTKELKESQSDKNLLRDNLKIFHAETI